MSIKNLVFDLGGVLIDVDFKRLEAAFEALGVKEFHKEFSQFTASGFFEGFEKGEISNSEFYKEMIRQAGKGITEKNIRDAWNAILGDFRPKSMEFLLEIGKKYRVFLLSNTNDVHLKEVNNILFRQLGVPDLDGYFEKAYYSQKIGYRKPYEDVYQYIMKDAGITAAETFFVDDSKPNTDTASRMGFKTHLLLPGERIEQLNFD